MSNILGGREYEIGKKSLSFTYDITDQDDISTVKEVRLYRGNQLVQKIDGTLNKEFTNLFSNTLYKVVYVVEKDFNDGNGIVTSEYEEYVTTKSLLTPIVDISFTSTQDSIFYKLTKVDNDNVLELVKVDVYNDETLVKSITDFTTNEITELDSNTRYTISITYKYNLNEGEDDIYKIYSKDYSTLSYNVKIISSEVINDKAPKTNEDVSIKLTLENKSKVKVDYLIVNGTKYLISGGDEYNTVIFIVRSPKMSGTMGLSIEKMGYTINGLIVEQDVEGEQELNVEILSRLDVVDISLVNGSNFDKNSHQLGYVFTIDNPYGYTIEKVNDLECIRIDDYHWFVRSLEYDYNQMQFVVRSLTYRDDDNKQTVRNYSSTINCTFNRFGVDQNTYSLIVKQISTPEEFMNMKENIIYELVNDIDMTGYVWEHYDFNGYFDGKGHTISNLTYIFESETSTYGMKNNLLTIVNNATFKNVYFKDVYTNVDYPHLDSSRIIAGSGTIENVLISGYVNYKSDYEVSFDPSNITYIVDHLYVNNVLFESDKTITTDKFNSTDFKENTLGWKFNDKVLGNYNGFLYNIIDNSYVMINGYNGNDTEIIFPTTIEGLPVIGIEDMAFAGNSAITSIEFSESLITIGSSVLRNCDNIENITILDGAIFSGNSIMPTITKVTLFGKEYLPNMINNLIIDSKEKYLVNFNGCDRLVNVVLRGNINLDYNAFYNCNKLTNVYYDGTIEDWCNIKFENSSSNPMSYASHFFMLDETNEYKEVTEITIPGTVKTIGEYQFYGFDHLRTINISEGVEEIGSHAFNNCNRLTDITLSKSIKKYTNDVFYNCNNLTNVYYDGTIEDWCNITFYSKSSNPMSYASHFFMLDETNEYKEVTEITIPGTVKTIGEYRFYGFDHLRTINISEGVEEIGSHAFDFCGNLKYAVMPNTIKEIGNNPFYYTFETLYYLGSNEEFNNICNDEQLKNKTVCIPGATIEEVTTDKYAYLLTSDNQIFDLKCLDNSLQTIDLVSEFDGYSVITLGSNAFSNLTSIIIPNTVTRIGDSAFGNCSMLENIFYTGSEEEFNNITVEYGNYPFTNASVTYNYSK